MTSWPRQKGNRVVDALAHPGRVLIMQHVKANPGCTFRSVVRATGTPTGTAQHHVSMLSRHKHLVIEMRGYSMALFAAGTGAKERRLSVLADAGLCAIYNIVAERGPCCQKDALAAAAMPHSTAQHRLDRLVKFGLVSRRPMGRRLIYEVVA